MNPMQATFPELSLFKQAHQLYWQEQFVQAREVMHRYVASVRYESFYQEDRRPDVLALCSVVIVTFAAGEKLLKCLRSLSRQTSQDFEIIVVDNAGNEALAHALQAFPMLYIAPPANLLPSEARNVGAHFARTESLVFLDDDALIHVEYVANVQRVMAEFDFLALRGRILPQGESGANTTPWHYDLGKYPMPAVLLTEGNMVVRKRAFAAVGGFDPLLFGREGTELTHRLLLHFPDQDIYYWPQLIIYHDFACGELLTAKRERQALALNYLDHLYPGEPLSLVYKKWYKQSPSRALRTRID